MMLPFLLLVSSSLGARIPTRLHKGSSQPSLVVSSTTLASPGYVEVSWTGYTPQPRDYIALYVTREPIDAALASIRAPSPSALLSKIRLELAYQAPVKYWRIHELPSGSVVGDSGRLRSYMINLRNPQFFVLVQARNESESDPTLGLGTPIAVSNFVAFANPREPMAVHKQLTGRQGEVRILWTQGLASTAASLFSSSLTTHDRALEGGAANNFCTDDAGPQVRWSEDPAHFVLRACASTFVYSVDEMCGAPANGQGWVDPGAMHAAHLTGMQPRDTVWYIVGDPRFGFSDPRPLAVPQIASPDSTLRFLALADAGQANVYDDALQVENWDRYFDGAPNVSFALAREIGFPDFIMHYGDISYARGYVSEWDLFHHLNAQMMATHPWMVAMGNHERDWPGSGDRFDLVEDSGGECGVAYQRRFPMPGTQDDAPWYSFEIGPVHFTTMSTEHDFAPGSPQHAFLEKDLASIDRTRTPWVIFGGHRPMYVDSGYRDGKASDAVVSQDLIAAIEPLLERAAVDLVFWGHHHSLQRTCPILRGVCVSEPDPIAGAGTSTGDIPAGRLEQFTNPGAPIHMVVGNGGAGFSHEVIEPRPAMFRVLEFVHGFSRVVVTGGDRPSLNVTSLSTDGQVVDCLIIRKVTV